MNLRGANPWGVQRVRGSVPRRLRRLSLLAIALATSAYVAVPALSSQPYIPAAVDFEQALPPVARAAPKALRAAPRRAGEGPVTHVSPVIEAPARFDLAGLERELRPFELRARDEGGEWGDWVETANGDPVYFAGADELQIRTRGWRPAGELHYVNVSGTASTSSSLLNGARGAINSAFIAAAGLLDPQAEAAVRRPEVISRAEWGAEARKGGCKPRANAEYGKVKSAAVHHTVSDNRYSESEAPGIVLGICIFHRNGNGWNDIGYNALVDRFGNLYEGRAGGLTRAVVGAHAQGFNAQTTGIASLGDHSSTPISAAALKSMARLIAWKLQKHGVPARGKSRMISAGGDASRYPKGQRVRVKRVIGHREVGLTACPGAELNDRLTALRRKVRRLMGAGEDSVAPPADEPPVDGGVTPK